MRQECDFINSHFQKSRTVGQTCDVNRVIKTLCNTRTFFYKHRPCQLVNFWEKKNNGLVFFEINKQHFTEIIHDLHGKT